MSKNFSGKAIYNPSGKAGEYSYWACNLYVGCSSKCEYCYCKNILRGIWSDKPRLKQCFGSEENAIFHFEKEINKNLESLQEHGLFFNFVSDPCLTETIGLNFTCIEIANKAGIGCKILTKQAWWVKGTFGNDKNYGENLNSYGFSLTGHDELETGADKNIERINAMKYIHDLGFKTFASIEPIIDLESSGKMIQLTKDFCNHYKIGVKSATRLMSSEKLKRFIIDTSKWLKDCSKATIYWKFDTLNHAGLKLTDLPENCVERDYKF